jgi:hypothetical protein
MATGAIVARILTQYSDKGSKAAQKDINKLGKNIDAFAKKSTRAFGLAAAASAAFAIKIGKDAVDAAISDQKSQTLLANSLRNTTGATDSAIAAAEVYVTQLQKEFNVVDDDLRPALGALTAATGSVTAAQTLMQTALNVSANSGADLSTSVAAIIAGTRGQFRALAKLVPGLDAATLATKDFGLITEKVSKLTAGSAAARAQTLEYRLMGLKIAYGEVLETLGYALLPVIERFVNVVSTKILPLLETWIATNKDRLAASFQVATDFAVKLLTVAVVTKNLFDMANGKDSTVVQNKKSISPRGNSNNIDFTKTIGGNDAYNAFLAALNKNTVATKKNTKSVMDIATANAMKELAARQKALSGSSSIAIGGPGSKVYGTSGNTTVIVNNAGSVITQEDFVTSIVNGIERTTRRSFGTVGAFDR